MVVDDRWWWSMVANHGYDHAKVVDCKRGDGNQDSISQQFLWVFILFAQDSRSASQLASVQQLGTFRIKGYWLRQMGWVMCYLDFGSKHTDLEPAIESDYPGKTPMGYNQQLLYNWHEQWVQNLNVTSMNNGWHGGFAKTTDHHFRDYDDNDDQKPLHQV